MKRSAWLVVIAVFLVALTVISCNSSSFSGFKQNYSGTNTNREITATYELLDGTQTKDIPVKNKDVINFKYASTVEEGELTITLEDADNEQVTQFATDTSGEAIIGADMDGDYRLVIRGKNTRGSFSISWEVK
jgi:hypothetical protein